MIIVPDTNIIHSDFLMRSGKFAILRDYLRKTQSKIILPKIVYDELPATYEREIKKRFKEFVKAKRAFGAIIQDELPEVDISIENEVASYLNYVKDNLQIKGSDIFDYKETYLHDVIDRAIHRRRPCTDRGEEIRDAILWHCVLDIADESSEKSVIFISNNTKQFAADDELLHPDLIEDCEKRRVKVVYFTSLDSFAKQHASTIEFITKEWLLEFIDVNTVLEGARGLIESYAEHRLPSRLAEDKSSTGYFNMIGGALDVEDFYVYEMVDGSLRVELMLKGETEVECEVEETFRKKSFEHDLKFGFFPKRYMSTDVKYDYKYLYPIVYITVEVIIKGKQITEWKVVDGSFEADV